MIGKISHSNGPNVSAGKVPVFTISVLTPTMWPWLLRGFSVVGLVLPAVSLFCIFMCKRERQTTVPIFRIVPLHLGGRHCIVGSFEWIDHWWMLGTHDGTRSCWKGHYLYSRSSIAMIYSMMISGIQFTWDWEDSGWLMLDAKWCSQGKKVYCLTALWLLQWVYNVDISPGLITKVLSMQQNVMFLSFSCIPWFGMCLFTCP